VEKDRAIRAKQEGRFLKDVARLQARIQNGQLKKEVKIGEAIGRSLRIEEMSPDETRREWLG
jgi:hypothetical protein